MSDFTKAAIIRLKTSIKGRTKTINNKEYREGFITGSRLVWDFLNSEVNKYKAKYYAVISKKKLYSIKEPKKKATIISIFPEVNHILEKIAINIMLERASMNYTIVGNVLGKRNHTTIMYHHNQKNLKIGYWKPKNEIWNIYEEINNEL
jgi:hypothetical protein